MHEHMNEPFNHVNCGQNADTKHSEQEMFHVVYLLNLFIATVIARMTETIASLRLTKDTITMTRKTSVFLASTNCYALVWTRINNAQRQFILYEQESNSTFCKIQIQPFLDVSNSTFKKGNRHVKQIQLFACFFRDCHETVSMFF